MTNAESITVSLEMAKKLKEAGWPHHKAIFYWDVNIDYPGRKEPLPPEIISKDEAFSAITMNSKHFRQFAAPTAEEILRRLPEAIKYPVRNAIEYELFIRPFDDSDERHWEVIYAKDIDNVDNTPLHETTGTLANAAAAMYCYLAEQKLLPSL